MKSSFFINKSFIMIKYLLCILRHVKTSGEHFLYHLVNILLHQMLVLICSEDPIFSDILLRDVDLLKWNQLCIQLERVMEMALEQVFLQVLQFFIVNHSTISPYLSLSPHCCA
jgi:hypothetical protein